MTFGGDESSAVPCQARRRRIMYFFKPNRITPAHRYRRDAQFDVFRRLCVGKSSNWRSPGSGMPRAAARPGGCPVRVTARGKDMPISVVLLEELRAEHQDIHV